MRKYLLSLFAFILFSTAIHSQTTIEGTVTDPDGSGVISAAVRLMKDGNTVKGVVTDFDGNYRITNIDGGLYNLEVRSVEFATQIIEDIQINDGATTKLNVSMGGNVIDNVVIIGYKEPLIDFDNTSTTTTLGKESIRNLGVKSVNAVATTSSGLSTQSGSDDIQIRGSRSGGTNYYVDGMRVTGLIPVSEIEQIQVITGGLGAQYGDVTGGVISLTSKGPSSKFTGALEGETSEFLDDFGYNFANLSFGGPIIRKKADENGDRQSILGFRVAAQYLYQLDDRPSYFGVYRMDEETIRELEENPVYLQNGTLLPSGELLGADAINAPMKTRPNEDNTDVDITGKLDARLSDNIDVSLTGVYGTEKNRFTPGGGWGMFNWTHNPYEYTDNYRINGRWRHKIGKQGIVASEEETSTVIRNASYTLILGTERENILREDVTHQDDFFKYGQYGSTEITSEGAVNQVDPENWNGSGTFCITDIFCLDHTGYEFNQQPFIGQVYNGGGELGASPNPALSAYQFQNGILRGPNVNVWGTDFFDNVGRVYNLYQKRQRDRTTFNVDAQFDILPKGSFDSRHNIRFGAIYETRTNRLYEISPTALWDLARDAANSQFVFGSVDTTSFTGDSIPIIIGGNTLYFQEYNRLISENSEDLFYQSIRNQYSEYGINDFVNIDGSNIDASNLSLDMFSVSELINWNDLNLNYYGYDHLGNEVDGVSFNDFFTQRDESGRRVFPVSAAKPTYISGYLQDKFSFKDIILRVGVRAEYFDANTKILKDPYSLYAIESAEEYRTRTGNELPGSVEDDYKVYVEGADSDEITAYRKGDQWYDSRGTATQPNLLFTGPATPSLKFPEEQNNIKSADFNPDNSFEDYTPSFNLSPRISLSFPISESAGFFAHYDELVQRPSSNTIFTALDYFFFEDPSRLNPNGAPANNPNLRPEKTIDYEVGFQQKLSNNTALKLSAYYRENRDMIQTRFYDFANLTTGIYETFGNVDFGTVKGFTVGYDFRRSNNVEFNVNYSLQFAEGTGSSSDSGLNTANGVVRVLVPLAFDERHRIVGNIDYRYEGGDKYNGPRISGVDIFANAGLNLQMAAVSGRPYTRLANATTPFGATGYTGDINGARLPWNFNIDARLDKSFRLFKNEDASRKGLLVNIYLRSANLLNTRNIINVYQATGDPADDGFLNSTFGQAALAGIESSGKSVDNYLAAYEWGLLNPGYYALPRRLFLGAIIEF